MTSGNFSEEPIVTDNRHALKFLHPIADFFLVHNRDILVRNDDSVCRSYDQKPYFLRRSRGYAPAPIKLSWEVPPILAVGGELKNTITLGRQQYAYVSQHIGDLENSEVFSAFESTINHLGKLLEIKPSVLAYDLHPEYLSTKYAFSRQGEIPLEGVQHHHAHIASCMAEHNRVEPVIGLSLDGTGFGTDGKIWGGEILICSLSEFSRAAHFRYIPMPGAGRAIREPWRMAVSYLTAIFNENGVPEKLPLFDEMDEKALSLIYQMLNRRLNCPDTSSLGRLFDGVAAICGIRRQVMFEGQAAIELEMCIKQDPDNRPYRFSNINGQIDWEPVINEIVKDVLDEIPASIISHRFHTALVNILSDTCETLRHQHGLDTVALSGGVFQNMWLLSKLHKRLLGKGFSVLVHHLVPCNDGGLSFGQLAVAAARSNPRLQRSVTIGSN
jgi:hydrogenase maturation protein HypF